MTLILKFNFDFIIFAVKPKDLNIAINNISRHRLNKKISIVSIVAGKKIIEFKKELKILKIFLE